MLTNLLGSLAATVLAAGLAPYGAREPSSARHLDLRRYMGQWYPIASVPPRAEREAFDAVKHYRLIEVLGEIELLDVFRDGAHDGALRIIRTRATVRPHSGNTVWDASFLGPLKTEHRILWLAADYSEVIVAAPARDQVWYMARRSGVPSASYEAAAERICSLGYDASRLRRIPRSLGASIH